MKCNTVYKYSNLYACMSNTNGKLEEIFSADFAFFIVGVLIKNNFFNKHQFTGTSTSVISSE